MYLIESLQLFSKIDSRESLEYQCSIKLTLRSLLSDSDKDNLIQISSEILEIMRLLYGDASEELANAFYPVGLIYYRFNEYENARIIFENSYNILEKINKKNPNYLKTLRYIRICDDLLAHENDLPLKLDINFDILELEKQIFGNEDNKTALTYNNISLIYYRLNDNLNAYKFLEKAILIYEKNSSINSVEYKSALRLYSSLCENVSYFNKAIESLKKEILMNSDNSENLLDLYLKLSSNYINIGSKDSALLVLDKIVKLQEEVKFINITDEVDYLFQIGLLYFNLSSYKLSNQNLLKAEEIITQKNIDFEEIETLLNIISTIFFFQNEIELSLKYRSKLLKYVEYEKGKNEEYYHQVSSIADLYSQIGKDTISLKLNLEILDFFEKSNISRFTEYLRVKKSIIHDYINLSKTSDAINLMNEVSILYDDSLRKDSELFLSFQHAKAKIYSEIGNFFQAHKLYLDCHKYISKNNINDNKYLTNQIYENLGISSCNLLEYVVSMMFLALVDTSEYDEHFMIQHKKTIAEIYIRTNHFNEAEKILQEISGFYLKTEGNNGLGFIKNEISKLEVLILKNQFQEAELLTKNLQSIVNKKEKSVLTGYLFLLHNLQKNYLASDTLVFINYNNIFSNLKNNLYGFSEFENLINKQRILNQLEISTNYALFRKNENPVLVEQTFSNNLSFPSLSLNILHLLNSELVLKNDPNLTKDFEAWKEGKQYLVRLYSYTKTELENKGIDLEKEEERINFLEQKLSSKLVVLKNQKSEIDWQDIQRNLKMNETYIHLVRLPYFDFESFTWTDSLQYIAFVVTPENKENPTLIILPDGNKMEKEYFEQYSSHAFENQKSSLDVLSFSIYWKPIQDEITKYEHIYLRTDGVYNKINVNTLYDSSARKHVIEQHKVNYVSDANDFLSRNLSSNTKPNFTATLVGYPDFNFLENKTNNEDNTESVSTFRDIVNLYIDTLQRGVRVKTLPGTKIEVENINKMLVQNGYTTDVFIGKEASEKNINNIKSPTILHIATHGYFFEDEKIQRNESKFMGFELSKIITNPMLRSGLLLAGANHTLQNQGTTTLSSPENGVLTAYEASYLNLTSTELVVLSACETGSGTIVNGEGIYGLRKSFKDAGAKNIIMSLWKVDDKVTQEFMTMFYELYLNGNTIKEAFNKTQLLIKTKYPEPYYWGAFILIGA